MDFAAQARDELMPLILRVLDLAGGRVPVAARLDSDRRATSAETFTGLAFAEAADLPLRAFFTGILLHAQAMREEDDIVALFYELSTAAFLGFEYSVETARAIDDLLGVAERIAFTMTAPVDNPH